MSTEIKKVEAGARDLVAKSRLGDQNATAMIIMIRESAKAGSKRAAYTLNYLTKYVKNYPVVGSCTIGFGCDPMTQRVINSLHSKMGADTNENAATVVNLVPKIKNESLAAVPLANTGDLLKGKGNNLRIIAICQFLTPTQIKAFEFGRCNCNVTTDNMHGDMHPDDQTAMHLGKAVGIAQRIQAVRLPHSPISLISKMAAWELGE